jgi:PRTRC genetic system ThiF family protein
MHEHILPEPLQRIQQLKVLVVGAGGNGSAVFLGLPYLHQAMRLWGHLGGLQVTLMDGDTVSETNCVRQPFSSSDIGLNKATVLVNRVNLFWGLNWNSVPRHFGPSSLEGYDGHADLIIGCVDTRAARNKIAKAVTTRGNRTYYYLDLGNDAATGQYILGQPINGANQRSSARLRCVNELYPEIADADLGEEPFPSCSALESIERQEPYLNQNLASSALAMLARLFHYGKLPHHGAFVNLETNRITALPVDPALWRKTSRRCLSYQRPLKRGLMLCG